MSEEIKPLTLEETMLKEEMKSRCLNKGQYVDEKAKDKFKMLCHLEDFEMQYFNLQQENQLLKEQVDYLRRSIERKEETIIELEHERIPYTNEYVDKLLNQQKDFIEYLENEIKERKIQIVGYNPTTQLLIEQIIETEKMVLLKYKEIIGGK